MQTRKQPRAIDPQDAERYWDGTTGVCLGAQSADHMEFEIASRNVVIEASNEQK